MKMYNKERLHNFSSLLKRFLLEFCKNHFFQNAICSCVVRKSLLLFRFKSLRHQNWHNDSFLYWLLQLDVSIFENMAKLCKKQGRTLSKKHYFFKNNYDRMFFFENLTSES